MEELVNTLASGRSEWQERESEESGRLEIAAQSAGPERGSVTIGE